MGTWDVGLYANDMALDLKAAVGAVIQVPVDGPQLVKLLADAYPQASGDEADEDYTIFWLALADQFHRRGIACGEVVEKAIALIDSGRDLEMQAALGMTPADLRKREKVLRALREHLLQPVPQKPRKTLKKPQPLLLQTGDVIVFPIDDGGHTFNPYYSEMIWKKHFPGPWEPVDWGAAVIINCGHAFGYLAYYTPLVILDRLNVTEKPTLDSLRSQTWFLKESGTCSKTHFQRMRLEAIGRISIDPQRLRARFPEMDDGIKAAASDISISNDLTVNRKLYPPERLSQTIPCLDEIARP